MRAHSRTEEVSRCVVSVEPLVLFASSGSVGPPQNKPFQRTFLFHSEDLLVVNTSKPCTLVEAVIV